MKIYIKIHKQKIPNLQQELYSLGTSFLQHVFDACSSHELHSILHCLKHTLYLLIAILECLSSVCVCLLPACIFLFTHCTCAHSERAETSAGEEFGVVDDGFSKGILCFHAACVKRETRTQL